PRPAGLHGPIAGTPALPRPPPDTEHRRPPTVGNPDQPTPPRPSERTARTAPTPQRSRMTRGLTLLFAVAGGAAVGNLYWAQPLLDYIAGDLHASAATAGWLITATQIG